METDGERYGKPGKSGLSEAQDSELPRHQRALIRFLFDESPQRLAVGIGFRPNLRHAAGQLGRNIGSSFVDELDAAIEPLVEPATVSS